MAETLIETKPETKKPQWMSLEEAEKYEKMLLKSYVKKGDKEDATKFIYRVVSMFPFQPAVSKIEDMANTEELLYKFQIQKFHRSKTQKVTKRDEQANQVEVSDNVQVDQHVMRNGHWVCVDPTASFPMEVREFKEKFEVDSGD